METKIQYEYHDHSVFHDIVMTIVRYAFGAHLLFAVAVCFIRFIRHF